MNGDVVGLLWLVVLLAANAFFVAGEFAVMGARRAQIETAIAAELERQGGDAISIDVGALAAAIEAVLGTQAPSDEGKRPDELNSTNDD